MIIFLLCFQTCNSLSNNCPIITIGNTSKTDWNWLQIDEAVQVGTNSFQNNSETLSTMLKVHFTCLVALVNHLDFLLPAIKLLRTVENHMIVYYGSDTPPDTILIQEDRPVVMLKDKIQTNKSNLLAEIYCPKELNHIQMVKKKIMLPSIDGPEWITNAYNTVRRACPNPLSQQTLYGASSMGMLVRDGKLVGGYYPKLFWYLGEKFKFNAVYKKDYGGYNVKTRSFVGMSNKVVCIDI